MRPLAEILSEGQALLTAGRPASVEALLTPYLAGGTGPIPLWKLLAIALRRQGRFAAARRIQEMVVETLPGDLPAHYDLADTLLTLGEFERGFREYRYRYSLPHTRAIERKVQRPRWEGIPIPGKTLLIHDEQGFGDTFQFIRLIRSARERSEAQVIVEVNQAAFSLIQRSYPDFHIIPRGQLPPPFDYHCELMSLPAALGLQLTDLPIETAYLKAMPERIAHWQARLNDLPRPLVALAWAGRPTHPNDASRSLPLAACAPLAHVGVQWVAVQKGSAADEAAPPGLTLTRLGPEIADFEDTAAILSVVDLLVSVDSSPAHLAGALGRPAWLLLPFEPEWRWLLTREDSPWYPQHRLFRQGTPGDWAGVMERVGGALHKRAGQDTRPSKRAVS